MYTGAMRRLLLLILTVISIGLLAPIHSYADSASLTISDLDIQYDLSKDAEGRSTLKTVETITADFPLADVNHGLERAIPGSYDGHSTQLNIQSVTDETGITLPYSTSNSNGNTVMRIGNANIYVHGTKTYVITYTQRDVTKYFANTNDDEFYWDTNGTEWSVPINALSVHLLVASTLKGGLNGNIACYSGQTGSTGRCEAVKTAEGFSVEKSGLLPGDNVTLAVGFKKSTFVGYQKTAAEKILMYSLLSTLFLLPVSLIIFIWLLIKSSRWSNRSKDRGAIITEFLPPKGTSIAVAAGLTKGAKSIFTAELLDFAVRGYLKIYETREKKLFKPAEYDIEIIKDISTLKAEEQEILNDVFGTSSVAESAVMKKIMENQSLAKIITQNTNKATKVVLGKVAGASGGIAVGSRLALKSLKNNTAVYVRMQDNAKQLKTLIRGEYAIRERNAAQSAWFKNTGLVLLGLSIVLLNPVLLTVAITSFILGFTLWPLTDKGLDLSRYLDGLKQYIGVAEVQRLRMLQSPEGVLKVGKIDVNNSGQVVKLYEKVLPYAVLFGQEKEWNKRIGQYYESTNTSPNWYAGNNAVFNAAAFSSAMGSFSSSASYSSASSSSSGGSSGGGSSGGGGGGGGGGGW